MPKIGIESMQQNEKLEIAVVASDIEDPVLGIGFTLVFKPEQIFYTGNERGEFFTEDTDPIVLVEEDTFGTLRYGATLRRDDELPSGGGEIARFEFNVQEAGEVEIKIEDGVIASFDGHRRDIENVIWEGAKVEVGLASQEVFIPPVKMDRQMDSHPEWYEIKILILIGIMGLLIGYLVRLFLLKRRSK